MLTFACSLLPLEGIDCSSERQQAAGKGLDAVLFLDGGLWPTKSSFAACVASCKHAGCLIVIKGKWWHHRFAVVAISIRISHTFFMY